MEPGQENMDISTNQKPCARRLDYISSEKLWTNFSTEFYPQLAWKLKFLQRTFYQLSVPNVFLTSSTNICGWESLNRAGDLLQYTHFCNFPLRYNIQRLTWWLDDMIGDNWEHSRLSSLWRVADELQISKCATSPIQLHPNSNQFKIFSFAASSEEVAPEFYGKREGGPVDNARVHGDVTDQLTSKLSLRQSGFSVTHGVYTKLQRLVSK